MVTVLIPAPVDATGDTTSVESVAPDLHALFVQWLGGFLETLQALDGMPRLEDLTPDGLAQMRERYFHAFLQQTQEAWDLLPEAQRQAYVQQRVEATCSLLSHLSGDASDFDLGEAFAELQHTFQTLEDIARATLADPALDEWQRRRVEALLDDAGRMRDGPFRHLSTLPGSWATDEELDHAKRRHLGARVGLRRLLHQASLLARKLRRAGSKAIREHAQELRVAVRRGHACLAQIEGGFRAAVARNRARNLPRSDLARAPATAPTDPGSTRQPILSNAPPAPARVPARTLAPV